MIQDNRLRFLADLCRVAEPRIVSKLLQMRDPAHGITPLGHAVAWGYYLATKILVEAAK